MAVREEKIAEQLIKLQLALWKAGLWLYIAIVFVPKASVGTSM